MTEPTLETGTILDVELVTLGSELAADATSGSTSITVIDATDYDPDQGGTVNINDGQYMYTVVDVDAGTLTLTPGLAADASEGDRVDIWDNISGSAAVEWRAMVELPGDVDNADALDARLASALVPQFTHKMGQRDPGTGESCTLQLQGGEWVITEIVGGDVQVDTSVLVPDAIVDGVTILGSEIDGSDFVVDDSVGGRILVYAQSGQTVTSFTTAGSSNWTVPSGVTTVKVECWGAGGGGEGTLAGGNFGGGAGGGGEYAREDLYTVTPLANIPYTVGAAGTGGSGSTLGTGGGDSSFDTTGVVAHGGARAGDFGRGFDNTGGFGSTNSVHFDGGTGRGAGGDFGTAGGGGGSSAGTSKSGNAGGTASGTTGGSGASAPSGGGKGGKGGNAGGTGNNGSNATAPGGGGGGAGEGSTLNVGGNGAAGKIRLTYGGTLVLVASMTAIAGVDDVTGVSYPAGVKVYRPDLIGVLGGYSRHATFSQSVATGSATMISSLSTVKELSDYSANPWSSGTYTVPTGQAGSHDVTIFTGGISSAARTTARILVNGTQQGGADTAAGASGRCNGCITGYWLNDGDTVTFDLFQNGGTTVTMTGYVTVRRN